MTVVLMLAAIAVTERVSGRIYSGGISRSRPSIHLLDGVAFVGRDGVRKERRRQAQ